jgi:hypothetical protein
MREEDGFVVKVGDGSMIGQEQVFWQGGWHEGGVKKKKEKKKENEGKRSGGCAARQHGKQQTANHQQNDGNLQRGHRATPLYVARLCAKGDNGHRPVKRPHAAVPE